MLQTLHTNSHLLNALNDHEVEYMVVGGLAVKYYWPQRQVDDLDLLIDPTLENKNRLICALREMAEHGIFRSVFQELDDIEERLHNPDHRPQVISLKGPTTLNADIRTPVPGKFDYSSALPNAVEAMVNDIPVKMISCRDLIEDKKLLFRLRNFQGDLQDIEVLENVCDQFEVSSY